MEKVVLFCFSDGFSLVVQAGLELTKILLPQPPPQPAREILFITGCVVSVCKGGWERRAPQLCQCSSYREPRGGYGKCQAGLISLQSTNTPTRATSLPSRGFSKGSPSGRWEAQSPSPNKGHLVTGCNPVEEVLAQPSAPAPQRLILCISGNCVTGDLAPSALPTQVQCPAGAWPQGPPWLAPGTAFIFPASPTVRFPPVPQEERFKETLRYECGFFCCKPSQWLHGLFS